MGWRDRLRYRFDEFMGRGTIALILGLFVDLGRCSSSTVALVVVAHRPRQRPGPRLPDPPALRAAADARPGDDGRRPGDRRASCSRCSSSRSAASSSSARSSASSTPGLEGKLAELRKGRSRVVERDHTVILGWSQQIHTVISEIVAANENQPRPLDRHPGRPRQGRDGGRRSERGSGSTGADEDRLPLGQPDGRRRPAHRQPRRPRGRSSSSRPEGDEPDADVIKTILAITNDPDRRPEPYHIVAEIRDRANLEVARMVGRDEVELILSEEVISRITAQTCRQSGLSVVYSELLDFAGDEIYLTEQPALAGRTFGETLAAVRRCVGHRAAAGRRDAAPQPAAPDTVIGAGDRLIVIAADDDRIHLGGDVRRRSTRPGCARPPARTPAPERTLVLGWNHRASSIIRELDAYVAPGSETLVVALGRRRGRRTSPRLDARLQRPADHRSGAGDSTDRATLDELGVETFDHIIVLCYDTLDPSRADARTLDHAAAPARHRGPARPRLLDRQRDARPARSRAGRGGPGRRLHRQRPARSA